MNIHYYSGVNFFLLQVRFVGWEKKSYLQFLDTCGVVEDLDVSAITLVSFPGIELLQFSLFLLCQMLKACPIEEMTISSKRATGSSDNSWAK